MKEGPVRRVARQSGLEGIVEVLPYMNHKDCIEHMLKSHVLLLLEGGRGSECFYTGKLFEYIRANRPILALVPLKGAAADLVRRTRTGIICDWSDTAAVERGIAELYDRWTRGSMTLNPNLGEIRKYERKALAGKLAGILDELAAGMPP